MNATKLLTALMAVLVVSAGAGAVSAASMDAETTTVDATYDEGTVSLTVEDNGTAVENVSVTTENFSGETDENGTVSFETNATELDVEFSKNNTTFERSYVIDNGSITEAENVEEEPMLNASASLDNQTVTVDVTQNGSAAENVSVTANNDSVGMTDANGTLSFDIDNETEELTLVFEKDNMSVTQEYDVEDGELVMADDEDDAEDKELSANENASDRAHSVLAVIQNFLNSGGEGNLGQQIQDALGDDRGNSENAKQNGNADEAGANGNADKADKGNADKADKADNGKQNGNADKKGQGNGNGNGNGHADDAEDDDDDEEEEEEEDDDEETETEE